MQRLTGQISQVPSAVSAIKVDGRRAYSRVRDGEQVELAARDVTVSRFEVLDVRAVLADVPAGTCPVIDVQVRVTVSSGTYVRALARDLGEMLGTGGHLTSLRRARVGGFGLDVARSLDELGAEVDENGVLSTRPMADAARAVFPVRELDDAEVRALSYGQSISPSPEPCTTAGLAPDGTLVALLENRRRRGVDGSRPVLVFAPA